MNSIWGLIKQARSRLEDDPHLANYMLRDTDEVKDAGLLDLAWAIHKSGTVHKNDVLGLIEHLVEYLEGLNERTETK